MPTTRTKSSTTTTIMSSQHVVVSEPGGLPATRIGGVVVFGRTSFRDVRTSCGPPSRIPGDERGTAKDGTDRPLWVGKDGIDRPPPVGSVGADSPSPADLRHRCYEGCSAGAEITCSTCADSPLDHPKCQCEANRETGKNPAKSCSAGGGNARKLSASPILASEEAANLQCGACDDEDTEEELVVRRRSR